MEYIKGIIEKKKMVQGRELEVWGEDGNLPILNKANTFLSPLPEMMVKIICFSNGLFLTDIKKLFCFGASYPSIEKAIKFLIEDGYLRKRGTAYGNFYVLSKAGIHQMRNNKKYIGEEILPTSDMEVDKENMIKHKIRSAIIADYVFEKQLFTLKANYLSLNLNQRNIYARKQFIKEVVYRDIRKEEKDIQKEEYLNIGMKSKRAEQLATLNGYSKILAEEFMDCYYKKYGFVETRKHVKYDAYINFIKENCLKENNINTYHFMKDLKTAKRTYAEIEILRNWNTDLLRYGLDKMKAELLYLHPQNKLLQQNIYVENLEQNIKMLSDVRRSIIMKHAHKQNIEEEITDDISKKISKIESRIETLKRNKELLEVDFKFQVLKKYGSSGARFYEERAVSFRRLIQNGIFYLASDESAIKIAIIQMQSDVFPLYLLHKKLTMVIQMYRKIFPLKTLEIIIFTHDSQQEDCIIKKMSTLQKKMEQDKVTAVISYYVEEIKVIATQIKLNHRYDFYNNLYEFIEKENK